jgi:pSer/pThr/pTyr-binding forkhead associated (FHA) protein
MSILYSDNNQPVLRPNDQPGGKMETNICPNCKNPIQPDWLFCDQCRQPLHPPSDITPESIPTPQLVPYSEAGQPPAGFLTGSLIIQNSNISLPIPQGNTEVIIGRSDPATNVYPDIDLDPYGGHEAGVGRQHARLLLEGGQLCLIDLKSTNGTYVNQKKIIPGEPHHIQDGDEIRLGRMILTYHVG